MHSNDMYDLYWRPRSAERLVVEGLTRRIQGLRTSEGRLCDFSASDLAVHISRPCYYMLFLGETETMTVPSGKLTQLWKIPIFQWENALQMVMFNSYVSHYQRVWDTMHIGQVAKGFTKLVIHSLMAVHLDRGHWGGFTGRNRPTLAVPQRKAPGGAKSQSVKRWKHDEICLD